MKTNNITFWFVKQKTCDIIIIMKILHVADLHLEGGYNRVGTEKNKLLREEGLGLFAEMISIAKKENASVVLLCGDLFDKLVVRKSTKKFVLSQISENSNIKFFYCLGNHDHKSLFEDECPKNLIVFPSEFQKYDLGEVVIGGSSVIKYKKSDFVSAVDFDKDRLNIFMLHAYLSPSKFDDCLTFEVKDLAGKNIDYLALGHIHTRTNGKIDKRGEWVYAGNGGAYGFGNYPRGYVMIEVKDGKLTWARHDFKVKRKFVDVPVEITNCHTFEDLKNAISSALTHFSSDDCVRVFFKGEYDEDFEKRISMLIDHFSQKYFYFDIRDDSKIKIDYEKIKSETLSLKAEMLSLIHNSSLSEEQKIACIKLGISALRGEEVEI